MVDDLDVCVEVVDYDLQTLVIAFNCSRKGVAKQSIAQSLARMRIVFGLDVRTCEVLDDSEEFGRVTPLQIRQ